MMRARDLILRAAAVAAATAAVGSAAGSRRPVPAARSGLVSDIEYSGASCPTSVCRDFSSSGGGEGGLSVQEALEQVHQCFIKAAEQAATQTAGATDAAVCSATVRAKVRYSADSLFEAARELGLELETSAFSSWRLADLSASGLSWTGGAGCEDAPLYAVIGNTQLIDPVRYPSDSMLSLPHSFARVKQPAGGNHFDEGAALAHFFGLVAMPADADINGAPSFCTPGVGPRSQLALTLSRKFEVKRRTAPPPVRPFDSIEAPEKEGEPDDEQPEAEHALGAHSEAEDQPEPEAKADPESVEPTAPRPVAPPAAAAGDAKESVAIDQSVPEQPLLAEGDAEAASPLEAPSEAASSESAGPASVGKRAAVGAVAPTAAETEETDETEEISAGTEGEGPTTAVSTSTEFTAPELRGNPEGYKVLERAREALSRDFLSLDDIELPTIPPVSEIAGLPKVEDVDAAYRAQLAAKAADAGSTRAEDADSTTAEAHSPRARGSRGGVSELVSVALLESGLRGKECAYAAEACQSFLGTADAPEAQNLLEHEDGQRAVSELMYRCLRAAPGVSDCRSTVALEGRHRASPTADGRTLAVDVSTYAPHFHLDWKRGTLEVAESAVLELVCESSAESAAGLVVTVAAQCANPPATAPAVEVELSGGVLRPAAEDDDHSSLTVEAAYLCVTPRNPDCHFKPLSAPTDLVVRVTRPFQAAPLNH